jgi:hypothetical protein
VGVFDFVGVGDLQTGSADILAMRRTLISFRKGRMREGLKKSPLVNFLEYQSGLYVTQACVCTKVKERLEITNNVCRIEYVARPISTSPENDGVGSFELDFEP